MEQGIQSAKLKLFAWNIWQSTSFSWTLQYESTSTKMSEVYVKTNVAIV